jgi:hypothetical protein
MKKAIILILAVSGAVWPSVAKANPDAVPIFHGDQYHCSIKQWTVAFVDGGRAKVSLLLGFEFPNDRPFSVFVTKPGSKGGIVDAIAWFDVPRTGKGEGLLEFEDDGGGTVFTLLLHQGVGWGSPSGIVTDWSTIDLQPRITRMGALNDRREK